MEHPEVRISQKQAQQMAKVIVDDVKKYIETHQQEYAQFLKDEESKEGGK